MFKRNLLLSEIISYGNVFWLIRMINLTIYLIFD